jgi:hypothetical protein
VTGRSVAHYQIHEKLGEGRSPWYEAHGVGRKGWKVKRFLDEA